jgi:TPR repeat protein
VHLPLNDNVVSRRTKIQHDMNESEQILNAKQAAARSDFATAVALLRPLAEAGVADAQFELGHLALTECELVTGREAFACFQAAASQGHAAAMYHLATFPAFVAEAFSSTLSTKTRWKLLIASAEACHVQAQYDVGVSLATGSFKDEADITADLPAAVGWYRKAAAAGNAYAQFNLATMLLAAEGCNRDVREAIRCLNAAAAQGHSGAVGLLDDIREIGVENIFPTRRPE